MDERLQIASVEDAVGDKGGEGDVLGCGLLFGDATRAFDEGASRLGKVVNDEKMRGSVHVGHRVFLHHDDTLVTDTFFVTDNRAYIGKHIAIPFIGTVVGEYDAIVVMRGECIRSLFPLFGHEGHLLFQEGYGGVEVEVGVAGGVEAVLESVQILHHHSHA